MFNKGLFYDGNWIADGHFFTEVERVQEKEFMARFRELEKRATVKMDIASNKFLFDDLGASRTCVLLGGGGLHYPVQVCLLEVVGVDLDERGRCSFKMEPESKMIFIYDEDGELMGGVMPLVVK